MKKVFFAIVSIALAAALFFGAKPIEKNQKPAPLTNGYPKMNLVLPDGSTRSALSLPAKSILVFYFPDCDHCQREATDFSKHITAFKNYQLWFIAVVPFPEIRKFAVDYKLNSYDYVHFVRTEPKDITDNYGGIQTPSVYVYSKDKKLVKAFNGETKVDEIVKVL